MICDHEKVRTLHSYYCWCVQCLLLWELQALVRCLFALFILEMSLSLDGSPPVANWIELHFWATDWQLLDLIGWRFGLGILIQKWHLQPINFNGVNWCWYLMVDVTSTESYWAFAFSCFHSTDVVLCVVSLSPPPPPKPHPPQVFFRSI